jgi:hypothetical protein
MPPANEILRREVVTIADTDALQVGTGQQPPGPGRAPLSTSEQGRPLNRVHGWVGEWVRQWVQLRSLPDEERRLDALRTKLAGQRSRRQQATRQTGRTASDWDQAADSLLAEAEAALERSDVDTAWSCFEEATRMDIFAYNSTELAAARTALETEAAHGLRSWRSEAITRLLAAPDHEFDSRLVMLVPDEAIRRKVDVLLAVQAPDSAMTDHLTGLLEDAGVARPVETAQAIQRLAAEREEARKMSLYGAMGLRAEDSAEEARQLARLGRQLRSIGGILALALIALLLLTTSAPLGLLAKPEAAGDTLWYYVMLFGVLGASLSTFRSISGRARLRLAPHLLHGLLTAARPLIGAIGALVAYVLLQSGVLGFRPTTSAAVLLVAFLAGFTERLVVRAVAPLQVPEPEPGEGAEVNPSPRSGRRLLDEADY